MSAHDETKASGEPSKDCEASPTSAGWYQALVNLAIHGQENKWWMIYIFLVFNSILVLSCSTLLAVEKPQLIHQVALTVFCAAGLFAAVTWWFMAHDYVTASNTFGDIAKEAEAVMPEKLRPFAQRAGQRAVKPAIGTIAFAAYSMALVFLALYTLLIVCVWCLWRGSPAA